MYKTITGKEAVELIEAAVAILILNNLACPSVEQPDQDEFWNVDLSYDFAGQTWEFTFHIWGDDSIEIEDNKLMLPETNGEVFALQLLKIQEL